MNLRSLANLSNICCTLKSTGGAFATLRLHFVSSLICCLLQAPRKEGKGTSNEVRKIHVINTVFFGLQLEALFLNLVYFDIASTFGSTEPSSSTDPIKNEKSMKIYLLREALINHCRSSEFKDVFECAGIDLFNQRAFRLLKL